MLLLLPSASALGNNNDITLVLGFNYTLTVNVLVQLTCITNVLEVTYEMHLNYKVNELAVIMATKHPHSFNLRNENVILHAINL